MELTELRFISELLGHSTPDQVRKPRLLSGAFTDDLNAVECTTAELWRDTFGVDVSPKLAQAVYTLTLAEYDEVDAFARTYRRNCDIDRLERLEIDTSVSDLKYQISLVAYKLKKQCAEQLMGHEVAKPRLSIKHELDAMPLVKMANTPATECVASVYGMNVRNISCLGDLCLDESYLNGLDIFKLIRRHPQAEYHTTYDLPWLLGTLTTDYAQEVTGRKVRNILTIGADFEEIEDRVISPLRKKDETISVAVNVVLATDKAHTVANHAACVLSASDDVVTLRDPKYEEPVNLPSANFWQRWVGTNLQAIVTVSQAA